MSPDLRTAIVQPGMFNSPPFSLPIPDAPVVEGETIPRRNAKYLDRLVSRPDDTTATLYDVLVSSAAKYGKSDAMGSRKLIKMHVEKKMVKQVVAGEKTEVAKTWTYFEMGGYEYETFGEYFERACQIGAGYRKLGLESGERVHIYASTRYVNCNASCCQWFQTISASDVLDSANWLAAAHGQCLHPPSGLV